MDEEILKGLVSLICVGDQIYIIRFGTGYRSYIITLIEGDYIYACKYPNKFNNPYETCLHKRAVHKKFSDEGFAYNDQLEKLCYFKW